MTNKNAQARVESRHVKYGLFFFSWLGGFLCGFHLRPSSALRRSDLPAGSG
jgi:hypothetical protein